MFGGSGYDLGQALTGIALMDAGNYAGASLGDSTLSRSLIGSGVSSMGGALVEYGRYTRNEQNNWEAYERGDAGLLGALYGSAFDALMKDPAVQKQLNDVLLGAGYVTAQRREEEIRSANLAGAIEMGDLATARRLAREMGLPEGAVDLIAADFGSIQALEIQDPSNLARRGRLAYTDQNRVARSEEAGANAQRIETRIKADLDRILQTRSITSADLYEIGAKYGFDPQGMFAPSIVERDAYLRADDQRRAQERAAARLHGSGMQGPPGPMQGAADERGWVRRGVDFVAEWWTGAKQNPGAAVAGAAGGVGNWYNKGMDLSIQAMNPMYLLARQAGWIDGPPDLKNAAPSLFNDAERQTAFRNSAEVAEFAADWMPNPRSLAAFGRKAVMKMADPQRISRMSLDLTLQLGGMIAQKDLPTAAAVVSEYLYKQNNARQLIHEIHLASSRIVNAAIHGVPTVDGLTLNETKRIFSHLQEITRTLGKNLQ